MKEGKWPQNLGKWPQGNNKPQTKVLVMPAGQEIWKALNLSFYDTFVALFVVARQQASEEQAIVLLNTVEKNIKEKDYTLYKTIALINIIDIATHNKSRIKAYKSNDHKEKENDYARYANYIKAIIQCIQTLNQETYSNIETRFNKPIQEIIQTYIIQVTKEHLNHEIIDTTLWTIDQLWEKLEIGLLHRDSLEGTIEEIEESLLIKEIPDIIERMITWWDRPVHQWENREDRRDKCFSDLTTKYLANPLYKSLDIKWKILPAIAKYNQIILQIEEVIKEEDAEDIQSNWERFESNDTRTRIEAMIKEIESHEQKKWKKIIKKHLLQPEEDEDE